MKRCIALLLVLAVLCSLTTAMAVSSTIYSLGDLESYVLSVVGTKPTSITFWYSSAFDNRIKEFHPILRTCGLMDYNLTYYASNRKVEVTNIRYLPNFKRCSTLYEVKEYIRSCAENLVADYAFYCPSSVKTQLGEDGDVFYNNALYDWKWTFYNGKNGGTVLSMQDIEYYPGFRIMRAYRLGKTSSLSYTEKQLYEKAKGIVQQASRSCSTTLQYEKYYHDYLCKNVRYEKTNYNSVNDTAVGALMYGRAECDGYADSFYLLCSMSGLQVGYQHGDADNNSDETHLWNTIYLGGKWYFVDVTYDDMDYSDSNAICTYRYFNMGSGNMPQHKFNSQLSAVSPSSATSWDYVLYTGGTNYGSDGFASVSTLKDAAVFLKSFRSSGMKTAHILVKGSHSWKDFNKAARNAISKGSWYTWEYPFINNTYTIFDILIK